LRKRIGGWEKQDKEMMGFCFCLDWFNVGVCVWYVVFGRLWLWWGGWEIEGEKIEFFVLFCFFRE
jgi:hypothetical protein